MDFPFTTVLVFLTLTAVGGAGVDFHANIKPLLTIHCTKCHGAGEQKGGLRLDLAEQAMAGGDSGPVIVPGASTKSELIHRITSSDSEAQMPPKGARLSDKDAALLRQWIDEGAPWPARDAYWAFTPPGEVSLPEGDAANPVDRFLEAKLAAAGIAPVPAADARTLLRRVFFDLVGVPPSPQETEVWNQDHSPDAFEKLIDRLLADPRHGERWARHWLDLVRYGESNGYEDDKVRPLAWRYRDYVIRSLNADKPYDRFVQEQLAGDELWPEDPDAWIATGFARLGAWDGMSKEPDKQRQDFLNDATDATGAVFLGMTLGCARCHDHKYDDISQRDYYRIQAFFAGAQREVRQMNVPLSEPAGVTAAFLREEKERTSLTGERDQLLAEAGAVLARESKAGDPPEITNDAIRKQADKAHPKRLDELDSAIRSIEGRIAFLAPKVEALSGRGHPVRLLKGGELSRPAEEVAPGFIEAMQSSPAASPEPSRTVLAQWMTSPDHPLTARVMVNRVWQHHFGMGLVATPSDFGRNGQGPVNQDLLDWLARDFVRQGWSLKKLHRLILTSNAWRRASVSSPEAEAKDPQNKLVWRSSRRRIEGEAIRDTILAVSGILNPEMGGPGVYARLPPDINVEFPNNDKELSWGTGTEADDRRRSIYLFQRRTLTFPLLEVFDSAPMNQSCAARALTTVAPQALVLFNGGFARRSAVHFAERLRREAGSDPASQTARAFLIAYARPPTPSETASILDFLSAQSKVPDYDPQAALADFCHVLLNSSELIFPD